MMSFIDRYLKITDNQFQKIIPIEQLHGVNNIVQEIINYLDEDYNNRFRIELLMFPSWATKSNVYTINGDHYTHIKIKSR